MPPAPTVAVGPGACIAVEGAAEGVVEDVGVVATSGTQSISGPTTIQWKLLVRNRSWHVLEKPELDKLQLLNLNLVYFMQ